jgi:FixJ family two-component response regulator
VLSQKPTVFVIDDDEGLRDALSELFIAEDYECCSYASAEDFLANWTERPACCAVIDIHMPGLSGLELQQELRRRGSDLPVVILTGQADVPKAVCALKAGAVDFIEKPFGAPDILRAVAEALQRQRRGLPDPLHPERDEFHQRLASLTAREREVLEFVVAGDPNKVIARKLGISPRTVENHRAKVMEKTGCPSLSALIHRMLRHQPNMVL